MAEGCERSRRRSRILEEVGSVHERLSLSLPRIAHLADDKV